ncbi:efflux RND transporter periplasmic adaptor subunit [Bdellovibrio svalbardensis]|uniref:HlyD family efflux transporter periplasmic adaptor subunit n=1 Tax=Bdellovibrio svalbardensis TaxID=2972972 RepID=A0ABT6DLB8_9BACT|nr:HlyD family efflux transporter periplasmic adaptor subunit [Bdellovibrio svalbardensis]MDG0817676.1 HlyD family efflux transporter periplasmic adaptor subunit [Bdellovibrio svalbardensis]
MKKQRLDSIRKIVGWIRRHPVSSALILILFVSSILMTQRMTQRSRGVWSEPLKRGPIILSVYGIGTVMANRSYQIKLGVMKTINRLYVKEGDFVQKGQKLVLMDQEAYFAPFAGTVTFVPFKQGENVLNQTPVLSLVDLNDRYLLVSLEQQGALRVLPKQKVRISFDSIRDKNYQGVVDSIYSNEGNFLARIAVVDLPARILPGMTGDVAIAIEEHPDALLLPVAAVENGDTVWIRKGVGLTKAIKIKTGILDRDLIEVLSGDLHEGDKVLIRKQVGP